MRQTGRRVCRDVNGHLQSAIDEVGQRSFRYTTNAQGLILKREETDHAPSTATPF